MVKILKTSIHPAQIVSNIKNHIPITLESQMGPYGVWSEIFRVHARTHKVLTHITKTKPTSDSQPSQDEVWHDLGVIILSCIYNTISIYLLHTIIKPKQTVLQTWIALHDLFQENQTTRAIFLEEQLA